MMKWKKKNAKLLELHTHCSPGDTLRSAAHCYKMLSKGHSCMACFHSDRATAALAFSVSFVGSSLPGKPTFVNHTALAFWDKNDPLSALLQ